MKKEIIQTLAHNFEDHSQTTDSGIEFWFARDLQQLLGYSEWRNFHNIIKRAQNIIMHKHILGKIVKCNKKVKLGSNAKRSIIDYQIDNEAFLIIQELSSSFKLNNFFSIRNESVVLQLVKKYCHHNKLFFKYQFNLDKYYYDCIINNKILLEFDEPHHRVSQRQKIIDNDKNRIARENDFLIFRVNLQMDIIDIILFIEKNA
ncbi:MULTISPECIES: hypothetical protein [unclassified Polaribacter]|uniref:hypothetical protein n=1 Tax=unclassified Polaribacter TaxID=196858 RepID=UPI0011BEDCC1|nr:MULTISPECIES: hypothetical protein [unclassified Polaribacter]TXD52779.1 hypothetical protein ES043_07025 [Polaribacter sp. IC063]TXD61656.1 hypothetical protein ES044_03985 [Polaribacter sp. IC066]